jgi:hypothetical protein
MSLSRALAVWFVLIGVEFVHGILRAIFLVPIVWNESFHREFCTPIPVEGFGIRVDQRNQS